MEWAPLPLASFRTPGAYDTFNRTREWLSNRALVDVVARCYHQTRHVVAQCSQLGCSASNCRLARGCILVTAQSLTLSSLADDVTIEWLSMCELARFQRLSLLSAAASLDMHSKTMVAVWIPSYLLAELVFDQYLPQVGVIGWAHISNADIGKAFARLTYKLQQEGSLTKDFDPLSDSPQLNCSITDFSEHQTLQSKVTLREKVLDPSSSKLPGQIASEASSLRVTETIHEVDESQEAGEAAEAAGATAAAAAAGQTPHQWQISLQQTINKFWLLSRDRQDRFCYEASKRRCKEGCQENCAVCRGCMYVELVELSDASGAFKYKFRGEVRLSSTGLRCDWLTVHELCAMGLTDARLLADIISYNRQACVPLVLRVPPSLVSHFLDGVSQPMGLMYWSLLDHKPATNSTATGGDETTETKGEGARTIESSSAANNGQAGAACARLGSMRIGACRRRSSVGAAGDGAALPAAPPPRRCCLSSCGLTESAQTGVRLFLCPCQSSLAVYCCREHQKEDWKTHKLVCPNSVKRGAAKPGTEAELVGKAESAGQNTSVIQV